jgi:lipopolysaccharide heptosyltransferase II
MDSKTMETNPGSTINTSWTSCNNILVIRADNLGDLIMSSPAIRALKQTFGAKITVLTSQMANGICSHIPEIDEVITYDLPWVKTNDAIGPDSFPKIVELINEKQFDAAVIFTVFSQNPLPAAMLAYLANIPRRLAYCRENPYDLLTDWVPDKEPYQYIKHQVERDLELVATVGATTNEDQLSLTGNEQAFSAAEAKMRNAGIDLSKPWLICHAPVSEAKRLFPAEIWIEVGKHLAAAGYQLLFTGTKNEKPLTDELTSGVGNRAFSVAGLFSLDEFISVIANAPLVVSVNTGTVHIAAAVNTPVVVLYAATNPQHTPWKVPSKVLLYDVQKETRSKNEVIQFLYREVYKEPLQMPAAHDVVNACFQLLGKHREENSGVTETLTPVTD